MSGSDGNRSYVSGNFGFDLDGVKCGFVKEIEGLGVTADVIAQAAGPTPWTAKSISKPKYEACTMKLGFSMGKPIYDWIRASWEGNYQRKKGAVTAANHKLESMSTREFYEAIITETTIPACDGSSKDPSYLTLKFEPEYIRYKKGDGKKLTGEFGKGEQKMWLPSNFRLEIPGLDCTKVNKIDSFTIKQSKVDEGVGDTRDQSIEPGKLEVPNLKITLSEEYSHTFYAWHEDFVIVGNNEHPKHKGGSLVYLNRTRQKELLTLTFENIGIFKISAAGRNNNEDKIASVVVELYCEAIKAKFA
jgi:phage tail-like protein